MPNILFLSANRPFAEDLSEQIRLYAPDFTVSPIDDGSLFDVVILDEKSEKLSDLRKKNPKAPVFLFLTENDDEPEDSSLLWSLLKPLSLEQFLNQLQSCLNVSANSREGYLSFNKYELHPIAKEILNKRNREVIKLTEKEVAVINYLYKTNNRIVSKNELLQEVWGYSPNVSTHTIETHIYRLRQKVEHEDESAQLIITIDGGYQLKMK